MFNVCCAELFVLSGFACVLMMKRELIALICHPDGPRCEKTCLRGMRDNKVADQPAHPRRLIGAFVFHVSESIIFKLATSINSFFKQISEAEETGFESHFIETPKTILSRRNPFPHPITHLQECFDIVTLI